MVKLNRRDRTKGKKAVLFFALHLGFFFVFLRGETSKQEDIPNDLQEFRGALNIRIHRSGEGLFPPAEILITDPLERRAGIDPRLKKTFAEIPRSSYESESIDDAVTGAPGPVTKILDIRNPPGGVYVLNVIGLESGRYSLEMRAYDKDMEFSDAKFKDIEIRQDEVHLYTLQYSPEKSSGFKVTPPLHIKEKKERKTDSQIHLCLSSDRTWTGSPFGILLSPLKGKITSLIEGV